MDPVHWRLAQIGLAAAQRFGFALAGGYAVQEHGLIERLSEDVDLFTAWDRREEFGEAVDTIAAAFVDAGFDVEVIQRFDTFARLMVREARRADHPFKVELAVNWRAKVPVTMDIGPVIHLDDAVAGKMSALYSRAEPRNFLDVDAAGTSGRFTRERLCELAQEADSGFEPRILTEVFALLERYPNRRFAAYGKSAEEIVALRARFADWRAELLRQ